MKKWSYVSLLFFNLFFCSCSWFDPASPGQADMHDRAPSSKSYTFQGLAPVADEPLVPVIIVGGGIAGLTSALYCAQGVVPCLVIEGAKPGGALAQSASVRNWPGVKDVPGAVIVDDLRDQVANLQVEIVKERLVDVDVSVWPYKIMSKEVATEKIHTRRALTVVIAMGTEPHYLDVPGEREYWGGGVSNCATCDGALYKNKDVVIVGGGDAAFVEASYLAGIARNVTLLVRSSSIRAKDKKMVARVLEMPHVKLMYTTQIKKIVGDGSHVTHIVIEQAHKTGLMREEMPVAGVFLAIGSRPNTQLFKEKIKQTNFLDHEGFIRLQHEQETMIPGIFAAGDICDKEFVQAVTAAGQGCKAALQAKRFLDGIGFDVQRFNTLFSQLFTLKNNQAKREKKRMISLPEIKSLDELRILCETARKPLLLDFYADYCVECQQLAALLEEHYEQLQKKVVIYKINVTQEEIRDYLEKLGMAEIQSVPQLVFVSQQKATLLPSEITTYPDLEAALDKLL